MVYLFISTSEFCDFAYGLCPFSSKKLLYVLFFSFLFLSILFSSFLFSAGLLYCVVFHQIITTELNLRQADVKISCVTVE